MTPQEIVEAIRTRFAEAVVEAKTEGVVDPFIKVQPAQIRAAALFLRDDERLRFDYLMCLSGVDHGKGTLGVVYHLFSMIHRHKITVKVEVPVQQPDVPTVVPVWPSANWHEREAYDLFGLVFEGHPDPRRILLPADYPGHPLRKDFKVPEFYHGMKVPY